MTKAVLLNSATGQLETTQVLPVVALRPVPHFAEVVRSGGLLTEVDTYADSSEVSLLHTKTIHRSSGLINSAGLLETGQTPLAVLITRSNGRIISVETIQGLLTITLDLNFSSNYTLIAMYGAGYA